MNATWDENYLTVERQTQESDLIVVGKIVQIDAGKWNSPDGKQWQPPEEQTLPIVYTTFYVEPTRVLKGEPRWGGPVAFRMTGVIESSNKGVESSSGNLTLGVGDTVVVFGVIEDRYGPGGVYEPADAYWVTMGENSIWAEKSGKVVNGGHTKDPAEASLSEASLVSEISSYVDSQE
jgi:hypothetical protein